MLYTILYYIILYYTILYYIILYYTILYYIILYYTILYYTHPYFTTLRNQEISDNFNGIHSPMAARFRRRGSIQDSK